MSLNQRAFRRGAAPGTPAKGLQAFGNPVATARHTAPRLRQSALLLLVGLGLLTGCAAKTGNGGWQHASLPPEQWKKDYAACRRAAERAVSGGTDYNDPEDRRGRTLSSMMDRDSQRRSFDREVDDCMRAGGYVPGGK